MQGRWLLVLSIAIAGCGTSIIIASAQSGGVVGIWRGQSTCVVRPSGCVDEDSVYRITAGARASTFTLAASKIVNGKEELMGTSECTFDTKTHMLECPLSKDNALHFELKGDVLEGTMTVAQKTTLWRRLTLRRSDK